MSADDEGSHDRDAAALWAGLDARREVLNAVRPQRCLGQQPPLTAYPSAGHSGRAYRPEWEGELLDLRRVDALLAQGEWFRQTNCHGEFWLGQQRYSVGRKYAKHEVAVAYDPAAREMVVRPGGGAEVVRLPAKGLSRADLTGELSQVLALPAHQLALPLTREAWRHQQLSAMTTGTWL